MSLIYDEKDQEEKEAIDQEQAQQDDEAAEENLNEQAQSDGEGAGDKFGYSMDDDEPEEGEDGDSGDGHRNRRKKNDDEDDEEDDEDKDKNNDEDKEKKDDKDSDNNEAGKEENGDKAGESKENADNGSRQEQDNSQGTEDTQGGKNEPSQKSEDPETSDLPSEGSKENGTGETTSPQNSETPTGENPTAETGRMPNNASTSNAPASTGAEEAAEEGAKEATEKVAKEAAKEEATTATAGAASAAGGAVASVAVVAIVVIIVIMVLIGIGGFMLTMPQFLWNKLTNLAQSLWDGIQGYVIGMDESLVNKDDIINVAQYLYDMGYDLVGMGFAEKVEVYDSDDAEVKNGKHSANEIKSITAPYLRAYLVAENRTYLINNYTFNLSDFFNSLFDGSFFNEGWDVWGTGLIDLDDGLLGALNMPINAIRVGNLNLGELVEGVKIDRETNTMRIRRLNLELAFWNTHFDYTYFSLEGWTGRYGKPFELLLTLHIATMAPDLVYEIAMNEDLDAKVHVKMKDTTFNGTLYVDGQSIDELEEAGTYDDETIEALRNLENKYASEIKTSIPYISSVTKHWFRNVYFEGTDSTGASSSTLVGVDTDNDGLEDYTGESDENGYEVQETRTLSADDDVYEFGNKTEAEMTYNGDEVEGVTGTITFKGTIQSGVTQTKDAVRGVTNPTTKSLFSEKYYIYDGTVQTATAIQEARKKGDDSLKQSISMDKDSLTAFTILESSDTLDAQYIYRDLKELVIELDYFEEEDFYEIEQEVLEWPVPDYVPAGWPDNELEKQVLEYGTLIACDETVADSLGMSVADLRKMTGTETNDDSDNDDDDYKSILSGYTFIGDEYIENLAKYVDIDNADNKTFYGKSGASAQYWINNIASLPSNANKFIIYLGHNDISEYEAAENLIDALIEKYDNAKIYFVEVMPVAESYSNADEVNEAIDTYNSHLREKCRNLSQANFIDASLGFVSGGYLTASNTNGWLLSSASDYEKLAENIAYEIKDTRALSQNDTDEEFVADFLKAAQEISEYIIENDFTYGSVDYIPPQSDGSTTESGDKKITSDKMVAWALYNCGYTDQPECGLSVGSSGDFIEYCEDKGWEKITNKDELQAGDIVFVNQQDSAGMKAGNVYIYGGEGLLYDCSSQTKIKTEQPLKENVSGFMCAYRVTGSGVISTGFAENLDVIAMADGTVTQVLSESNNIYTDSYLSTSIYGEDLTEKDDVEGREQSLEGIRMKITSGSLKGYILIIYGFDVNDNISEGTELVVGDVIGKTENSDICIILLDKDKAVLDDVEDYIKVPEKTKDASTGIYADLEAIDENSTDAEKVRAAVSYFVEKGFTVEAACGIVGNLIQESSLNPKAVSSSGYHGLAQWNTNDSGGHWWDASNGIKQWIISQGYNEDSFAGQIRAIYEADRRGQMTNARWEELKSLTNVEQAAEMFAVYYEACVGGSDPTVWYKKGNYYQQLNKRKQYAQNAYDIYMGDNSKGIKD